MIGERVDGILNKSAQVASSGINFCIHSNAIDISYS